jgi:hypothetical protein
MEVHVQEEDHLGLLRSVDGPGPLAEEDLRPPVDVFQAPGLKPGHLQVGVAGLGPFQKALEAGRG